MTRLYMDTHKIVRLLQEKGYSESEAEGFVQAIQEITLSGVASKEDLRRMEKRLEEKILTNKDNIQTLENSMAALEASLRQEIATLETNLRQEIGKVETNIHRLLIDLQTSNNRTILAGVAITVTLTVGLIKLIG
jgi:hypothetical protein